MRKRLGEILIEYGVINDNQLSRALDKQKKICTRLGEVFVRMGLPMWDVEAALAEQRRNAKHLSNDSMPDNMAEMR